MNEAIRLKQILKEKRRTASLSQMDEDRHLQIQARFQKVKDKYQVLKEKNAQFVTAQKFLTETMQHVKVCPGVVLMLMYV